jgi:SAM-dependent methyltransferase
MSSPSMSVEFFQQIYTGKPAWEIDQPQPTIIKLQEAGAIEGAVLDIGCGTGCNAIYLAGLGHLVTAFDLVPTAIEQARDRLGKRPLPVAFYAASVLALGNLGVHDTAIDAGVFHVFNDKDRLVYAENIHRLLKPGGMLYLICFSEHQPGTEGPRRVTQQEIRDAFAKGWTVEKIEPSIYQTMPSFYGDAKAWLASIRRV